MYVYVHVYKYKHIYMSTNVPFFFGTHNMAAILLYLTEKKIYYLFNSNSKQKNKKISTKV